MIRSARWWFVTALAAGIVVGSVRADQRVIVLLDRPQGAPIDRNAARIYAKWRVVPGFAATVDDTELQRLRNDPDVISVEPDLAGSVTAVSNGQPIGLNGELIGLGAVQALGYDGTGSTVAVLGTGVSPHPDLNGRIVEERCYCAYANNKGCCPNGATEQFGSGSARDDLVRDCGRRDHRRQRRHRAARHRAGSEDRSDPRDRRDRQHRLDFAGDLCTRFDPREPRARRRRQHELRHRLSVEQRVRRRKSRARRCDRTRAGYGIQAPAGKNGISNARGTSFAAPHVAGAVALLRQIDPQLTPDAIEQLLESTGRPIVDSRNGVTTPRLDLFAAVMKLRLNATPSVRRRAVRH